MSPATLLPAPRSGQAEPLLQVQGLVKHFRLRGRSRRQVVRALDGVDLTLHRARTLGLVGESGCGKSTLATLMMALQRPTAGSVRFEGQDLFHLSRAGLRRARRNIQMVWQDPYASLNPRLSIGEIVAEPLVIHRSVLPRRERSARVRDLLDRVGLNPDFANRYPHQLSGGMRQRVGIARALALHPKVLICDEPVSALDVSVRAQVLNLLEDLQAEFGLAYLLISHDLSVVHHSSDEVAVMYLGRIVEQGTRDQVYSQPAHPYTQALLAAAPIPDPSVRLQDALVKVTGDVPSPVNPPSGCHFRTRCPLAQQQCATSRPALAVRPGVAHFVACLRAEQAVQASRG